MMDKQKALRWRPSDDTNVIRVVDAHTGGEPLRVVLGALPDLAGDTVLEKRRYFQKNYDHIRTALMLEPRGHADMYGCIVMPATTSGADFSVLFLHNEGYSTMCGHGIIAVTTVAIETGMIEVSGATASLEIDTPAGRVSVVARIAGSRVESVHFRNVPSWVEVLDAVVDVPGLGSVTYDLAFGGAYYAFVNAEDVGVACESAYVSALIDKGRAIKKAVQANREVHHPYEEDLSFIYGTIFVGPAVGPDAHSRNVCVFADGEVDRSPTGTGVSARAAIHHQRGELGIGHAITIESIVGSRFTVEIVEETTFGPHKAVIPQVEGRAYITGLNTLILGDDDPFRDGFFLR